MHSHHFLSSLRNILKKILREAIRFTARKPKLKKIILRATSHFPIAKARLSNFYQAHSTPHTSFQKHNDQKTNEILKKEEINWALYPPSVKIIYEKLTKIDNDTS
ncbi:MAG: hypothetical protein K0Q74_1545 [Gammaproteobacteria bacterium]|jgi:hypothetical protein|nr:hypothetical protein [Gammaproteobacteria bacterium]